MTSVISIQSQVCVGAVGNTVARYAFARAGIDVVEVPTVILSNLPHLDTVHGGPLPLPHLRGLLQGLEERGAPERASAIVLGYLGNAEVAETCLAWVASLRKCPLVLVDPVMGDRDVGLYVDAAIPALYASWLPRIADVATPNAWEAAELARVGLAPGDMARVATVVTSAVLDEARIELQLWQAGDAEPGRHAHPRCALDPKGTGDLFAATLAAALVAGQPLEDAVRHAAARTQAVVEAVAARGGTFLGARDILQ